MRIRAAGGNRRACHRGIGGIKMMYEVIKRLYKNGKLTNKGLVSAVTRGWITPEQAEEIEESA